jgi:2-dehydropantoate 2-reductase
MVDRNSRIVVAGAGSIGCYVGGTLAREGRSVTLLVRSYLEDAINQHGVRISDLDGRDSVLSVDRLSVKSDPGQAFANADVVLVSVKSGATAEMGDLIAKHAPGNCVAASLQNGVNNTEILRARMGPGRTVVAGMVPFNVVHEKKSGPPHFHRSTSGAIVIDAGTENLKALLDVPGLNVEENTNIEGVLWAKLLVNLNNAPNALSGRSILEGISDRGWRKIFATQMEEALRVYRAAGIQPAPLAGLPAWVIPRLLRLPNFLFKKIAPLMVSVDPRARTSMLEDLERRRPTEIDYMHGEVTSLARKTGIPTPTIDEMIRLVKQAEAAGKGSPHLSASDVHPR